MNNPTEVTICGCTFIVSYRYYKGIPADSLNPADPPEVEIISARIKGQSDFDANAEELLEAIKVNIVYKAGMRFDNGFDLLQQKLLARHNQ